MSRSGSLDERLGFQLDLPAWIDEARDEAMLRSEKPTRRGESRYYYELMLKGATDARLCRYQASPKGTARKQVTFPITHEALAKVVSDLAGGQ